MLCKKTVTSQKNVSCSFGTYGEDFYHVRVTVALYQMKEPCKDNQMYK